MCNSTGALAKQRYQSVHVRCSLRPVDPLLLITNSHAGTNETESLDRALAVLCAAGDVEVAPTSDQGELDGVLHRRGCRGVVVAGGDGSLHTVIAALHRRQELHDAVLGLIPLGTGNDFARGAAIPLDPEDAARLIVNGDVRRVDMIVDDVGGIVVNSVHVGVGAEATRKAHKWKQGLGRVGYGIGATLAAANPPFVRLRVQIDGEVVASFDRPILQVAVGNGSTIGGGTEITPEADHESGQMDVMVSFAVGPFSRFGYAAELRKGEHHKREDVVYRTGSTVSVSGQAFCYSADGELYGPERHRTWRVEPKAFSMRLPH